MAFSTINKSSSFMNPVLHTGNGSTQSITGVGFEPSLTWIKGRHLSAHKLTDAVRGVTKEIEPHATGAEYTEANGLTAFGSDGFTVGSDGAYNGNTNSYVSWNWKANGAGSSNTDGSITATVSASTASGFSLVKWTGTASAGTIGHGLGVAPKIVIVKRYSTSGGGWLMQNSNLTSASYVLKLNAVDAESNDGANFNSTAPTSSVFSVYNSNNTNASGADHIAYCFAEVAGYSKFGKYTGNGNADGTFVYTGFKPSWVMTKRTDSAGNSWRMFDNKRDGANGDNANLHANLNNAEDAGSDGFIDLYSNGFRPRTTSTDQNADGATYIFMAFGQPIISNSGVCATAR